MKGARVELGDNWEAIVIIQVREDGGSAKMVVVHTEKKRQSNTFKTIFGG